MNGLVIQRNWVGSPLVGGYVRTKTVEVVLSATFTAVYHIVRQFKVMVFPTVFIRFAGVFALIQPMFLPWKYTLVVPILVLFTSVEPIGSFFALLFGTQVVYFSSRLLKRYKILSLILGTLTANFASYYVRVLIGLIPADVGFLFYLLKFSITAAVILAVAPLILKTLTSLKVVDFKRQA
ncbi:hypothetical protein ES703_46581 [subsurface metagenome]